MPQINVIWYGLLLLAAGAVTLSTPEWTRNLYVKSAKNRRTEPLKRPEWRVKEQTLGYALLAVGVAIVVLRLAVSGLAVDLVASLVLFVMIAWRVFGFVGAY